MVVGTDLQLCDIAATFATILHQPVHLPSIVISDSGIEPAAKLERMTVYKSAAILATCQHRYLHALAWVAWTCACPFTLRNLLTNAGLSIDGSGLYTRQSGV